jgi:hypothetical protein
MLHFSSVYYKISVSDLSPFLKPLRVNDTLQNRQRKIMQVSFDYTEFREEIRKMFYSILCRKINNGGVSLCCML